MMDIETSKKAQETVIFLCEELQNLINEKGLDGSHEYIPSLINSVANFINMTKN